ncbi:phosphatidylethanolamine-binding protein [Cooperia oncophora]
MADVAAAFAQAELTPSVIENAPKQKLHLTWDGIQVEPGMTMSTRNLKERSSFPSPRSGPREHVLLIDDRRSFSDPDNLSRKNPSVAEWLHWLVCNIPASNVLEGINGGQHQMPYGSPAPQPRTDIHRYVILMWEHQGRRINVPKPSTRAKFNVKQFIEKHKLGDPIAGNFFLCQHE